MSELTNQGGEILSMPHSQPMASIGHRCHELRVRGKDHNWRIVYRIDVGAIVIAEVYVGGDRSTSTTGTISLSSVPQSHTGEPLLSYGNTSTSGDGSAPCSRNSIASAMAAATHSGSDSGTQWPASISRFHSSGTASS
jgi:hypothetical protein